MRGTLYAKIIPWFFVTLAVQVALSAVLFNVDARFQPNVPFFGRSQDQLVQVGWRIVSEMSARDCSEHERILQRWEKALGVALYIFADDGRQLHGRKIQLPSDVYNDVTRYFVPRPLTGPALLPAEPASNLKVKSLPDEPPSPDSKKPMEMFYSFHPLRFWGVVKVPYKAQGEMPLPVSLIAVSDSATGHGLFFNVWPWVIVLLLFLLLGVAMWIPVVRHLTRPLKRMSTVANSMTHGRFDERVDENRKDEIGDLGKSVNELATQLDSHLLGQRRFLADISHELTAPVARAKLALSIVESNIPPKEQKRVRQALGEMENLSELIDRLLAFTRTQIGSQNVQCESLKIESLLREVSRTELPESCHFDLKIPEDSVITGDEKLLKRAVVNILRNAIRYGGNEVEIHISAQRLENQVIVSISDNGPGVPEAKLPHIFKPFYRAEESRDRKSGGVGLGLAIAKSSIEACGGQICARNNENRGLTVTMTFQAAPPATA